MTAKNINSNRNQSGKLNLRNELNKYLKYWPWFVLSIVLCLLFGYFYLRYTTPIYSAKATAILKSDGQGGEMAIYSELGLNGMGSNDLVNEIGILQSRSLMKEVVKSLDLHIQYFKEGNVRKVEIYDKIPFSLQVLRLDEDKLKNLGSASFEILKADGKFKITNLKTNKSKIVEDGSPVNIGFADVVFSFNGIPEYKDLSSATVVKFQDLEKVASKYRGKISLNRISNNSGLMELELKDPIKQKAGDILDQLILEYNRNAIEDKNLIAGNTANFINERLAIINGELDSVETGKENFKEENRLTDLHAQSQLFLQNANEYNKQRQEVGTQLELANAILEYISSNSQSELLPTNLGLSEGGVNQQINEYNNLVLERNRILSGSGEKNPVIIRLNTHIEQLKGNIVQSLKRMRSNLQIGREDLNRQASSIGSQIYAVPAKEREFRGIERQQNIKETLYLFLLQKREENSLSLAVTEPKAKIVDRAFYSSGAVSPNSRNIYLGSFIMGLFIPFSVIYLRNMMDIKIRSRDDFENFTNEIPLLGVLPKVGHNNAIIGINDRSVLAESFRILISNLQYSLVNLKGRNKGVSIIITSTIKGEGKTFTAINLSLTLANTGKKVLLLGMDLRNPKLKTFILNGHESLGVSEYLVDDSIELRKLIKKSSLHPELDIMISGGIPPNPYELLKQEKVGVMLAELKTFYDYVIIDTAPSMLVADTFAITRYADLTLFILRAGYTEKDLIEFALDAKEEGKLQKVSFVLNDVKPDKLGYGNKYGYGYGGDKKGFWSRKRGNFKNRKKNHESMRIKMN